MRGVGRAGALRTGDGWAEIPGALGPWRGRAACPPPGLSWAAGSQGSDSLAAREKGHGMEGREHWGLRIKPL